MANSVLIKKINKAWNTYKDHQEKSNEAAFKTGKLLIQLKKEVEFGDWQKFVEKTFPNIGHSTANKLMSIAGYERFQKPEYIPNLPNSWGTLHKVYVKTKNLPDEEFKNAVNDNVIHKDMTVKDAGKLGPKKPSNIEIQVKSATPKREIKLDLKQGDCLKVMATYPENHFDSIVCDPPYGIDFLNKVWDKDVPPVQYWEECLRVLKPGGYLMAFSAAKTYHRLATNIEDAGFEIRDQISWIYYSGLITANDIGKAIDKKNIELTDEEASDWKGRRPDLKRAHDPIVVARKTPEGTTVENVLKWGTGALNIDACRVPFVDKSAAERDYNYNGASCSMYGDNVKRWSEAYSAHPLGKYPTNVISEIPEHAPYFNCPKVESSERNYGFGDVPNMFPSPVADDGEVLDGGLVYALHHRDKLSKETSSGDCNNHLTVKPVELMRHLVRLATPLEGGKVLDPFMGSGSTGMACVLEGMDFVGIDLDQNYIKIAKTRIKEVQKNVNIPPANDNELLAINPVLKPRLKKRMATKTAAISASGKRDLDKAA